MLGWREVPVDSRMLGPTARRSQPVIKQLFIARHPSITDDDAFERKLYVIRRRARHAVRRLEIPEKAQLLHLQPLVPDDRLQGDAELRSADRVLSRPAGRARRVGAGAGSLALLDEHLPQLVARASLPDDRAQRRDQHAARQRQLDARPREHVRLASSSATTCRSASRSSTPRGRDSGMFDNVLELLFLAGRSLPHAMMMMIPEPWSNHESMSRARKDFYEFHGCLMEPWDGPASVAFTDGVRIGATLDRNGLRPSRYYVTKDGLVVMASEVGVLDIPPERILEKGRLQPGRMFLVDTAQGRIIGDDEIKDEMAAAAPYGAVAEGEHDLDRRSAEAASVIEPDHDTVLRRQEAFGYTTEDLKVLVAPMAHRRRRGERVDGDRHAAGGAVEQAAAPLQLLQAAVRPGDQPAGRRHPRRDHHGGRHRDRPRGQPARADARIRRARSTSRRRCCATRSSRSCATSTVAPARTASRASRCRCSTT